MGSIAQLLKTELSRIARREIRALVEPLRKQLAMHRRQVATSKRQLATLERLVRQLKRENGKALRTAPPQGEESQGVRFSAKGLKALRTRFGFSAAEMGRLVGVSGQSVYNWENRKSVPRKPQVAALAQLRGLGKRAAVARLEELA